MEGVFPDFEVAWLELLVDATDFGSELSCSDLVIPRNRRNNSNFLDCGTA